MGANSLLTVSLAVVLGLAGSADAQSSKSVRIKVSAVKASGKVAKGTKPAIPPDLEPIKGVLGKLGYDRYQYLMAPESRGAAGAPFEFKKLPEGHTASVTCSDYPGPSGDLQLQVTIDKPAKAPAKGRVKVATMKVRVKSGASFAVKCPGAYADGDLLLVVTATRQK